MRNRRRRFFRKIQQKQEQKQIARERIQILWEQTQAHPERSQRYIELITKIAKKYRIRINNLKNLYCHRCYRYLIPGKNCKIRIKQKKRVLICDCGKQITNRQL